MEGLKSHLRQTSAPACALRRAAGNALELAPQLMKMGDPVMPKASDGMYIMVYYSIFWYIMALWAATMENLALLVAQVLQSGLLQVRQAKQHNFCIIQAGTPTTSVRLMHKILHDQDAEPQGSLVRFSLLVPPKNVLKSTT